MRCSLSLFVVWCLSCLLVVDRCRLSVVCGCLSLFVVCCLLFAVFVGCRLVIAVGCFVLFVGSCCSLFSSVDRYVLNATCCSLFVV